MKTPVSIIIPTHNRKDTLLRNLKVLEGQTYPLVLMEVIVVADGCIDKTVDALRNTKTAFALKVIEQERKGAATSRNKGAEHASGTILIFLDDDIEPSPFLVEAHVKAHNGEESKRVVVGYLPPVVYTKHRFLGPQLREWWEKPFEDLRHGSYRFNYRSLTSGNFSIKKQVFFEVGGFNTDFKCQEDYELGLRLILGGVQFCYSEYAMGYHHEMADLKKCLKRKYDEGKSSFLFSRNYVEVIPTIPLLKHFEKGIPRPYKALLFLLFKMPSAAELYASYLKAFLWLAEWLRKRNSWLKYLNKLMGYYFLKGFSEEAGSFSRAKKAMQVPSANLKKPESELTIDLKDGVAHAEQRIDQERPDSINIYHGSQYIGKLVYRFGYEPWRGAHLRAALVKQFQWETFYAIAVESLQEKKSPKKEKELEVEENTSAYTGS